jgi:hypothetical protein
VLWSNGQCRSRKVSNLFIKFCFVYSKEKESEPEPELYHFSFPDRMPLVSCAPTTKFLLDFFPLQFSHYTSIAYFTHKSLHKQKWHWGTEPKFHLTGYKLLTWAKPNNSNEKQNETSINHKELKGLTEMFKNSNFSMVLQSYFIEILWDCPIYCLAYSDTIGKIL